LRDGQCSGAALSGTGRDAAGDIAARREAFMNAIGFYYIFKHHRIVQMARLEMSKWPNNYDGVRMLDGIALLIGAMVFIKDDSIPGH
jgi:hypothetical protein